MNSHELAHALLALPDLPAINSDDAEIDSVEVDGDEVIIYSEDDENEDSETPEEDS